MAEALLGSLLIQLGMDSAQFERATQRAQSSVQKMSQSIGAQAKDVVDASNRMGISITAFASRVGQLQAQLNPGQAALANYRKEADLLKEAFRIGAISQDQFTTSLRTAIQGYKSIGAGAAQADKALTSSGGSSRMVAAQFSQMGQQIMAGTGPIQAFAMQLPDIALVMGQAGKEASGFASILGGTWGIAITTGIALLANFIPALMSSGDEAEKAAKAHETLADKLDMSRHSYDEVIAAAREYNAEQSKANQTTLDAVGRTAAKTAEDIKAAIAIREKTKAMLDAAYAEMDNPRNAQEGAGASVEVSALQSRIADEDAKLGVLRETARNAVADVADALAKIDTDPVARIRSGFDELRKQAKATITDVGALRQRLATLNTEEQKQVDIAEKAKRAANSSGSAASDNSMGSMKALLQSMGMRITSTTGGVHTANSDHYKGNAIDFVPSGGMGQYSKAQMRQMLEDAGVNIRRNAGGVEQFFGPGDKGHSDHFHVAWTGTASPEEAQRRQAAAAAKVQAQADTAARNQQAYENEKARLSQQLLDAQQQSLTDTDAIAESQRQQVQTEKDREDASIETALNTRKYTAAQAEELKELNASAAAAKVARINRQQQIDQINRSTELQSGLLSNEVQSLQLQEDAAKTNAERRRIALQILDYETEEARLKYQQTIDLGKLGEATAEQVKIAQDGLTKLDANYALQRNSTLRQTAGPMESYKAQLQDSVADMNSAMEGIEVGAIQNLTDGLAGAVAGTQKLGNVFKNVAQQIVADLIKIQIQKAIVGALDNVFGGLGGTTSLSSNSVVASAAAGYDFTSFGNISLAGAKATGGPIIGGLPYLVGERGPEIVVPGSSSQVIPNHELAGLGGGGGTVNNFYGPGADAFWGEVSGVAGKVAAPMAVASGLQARSAAGSDVSRAARRKIPGR
ncbi:hypothetical protein EDF56_106321 [Novosphingobium sp. PhB165]|uniref:hypothetical protein n=1 Tax=Novosphingobium sp. PhB165 TaxID=2485105 RepID=UPI001043A2D7|nr:hypothetical protein [Novosphingobium sp. PhB165]TCM17205.1 hypothetical protein EDF56_106321 [Novosphingobium sp. PhB165]